MESLRQLRHESGTTSPRQRAVEWTVSLPRPVERLKKPEPELVVGRAARLAARFLSYVLFLVKLTASTQSKELKSGCAMVVVLIKYMEINEDHKRSFPASMNMVSLWRIWEEMVGWKL